MFPKELARVTKHKKPLHQLYQPGFNISNSCWLDGGWITVPAQEWESRKAAHLELYKNLKKQAKSQSHRGPKKEVSALSPAEKQAYEYFSGTTILDCLINGRAHPVEIDLASNKITQR